MSKQIEEVMALVDKQTGQFLAMLKLFNEGKVEGGEDAASKARETRASIEAKLRELLPVWQPIESCLDDDWVIVWLPADEAQVIAQRSEGNWFGDDGLLHEDPTLWMPLQNDPAT